MNDLQDRVALITGGAQGIGKAAGLRLASRGAKVVLADIALAKTKAAAADLRDKGLDATAKSLDVTDRNGCEAMVAEIRNDNGPVSILVNNAGIVAYDRIGDRDSPKNWDAILNVNLTGYFNMLHAVLPDLKITKGVIVNIASVTAFTSGFGHSAYTASKGGVKAFTQAMCRELAEFEIRCNAVAPGYIETEGMGGKGTRVIEDWIQFHVPQKRHGKPEEVGAAVAFLCSPEASFVNGVTLPVDGGYLAV